ncbi:hypothetical protein F4680DRAFT_447561 [Xylaria scruposa]|nr:hypothetical protein F4680DRAFT_447561 [Xylaria scruposa]
MPPPLLFCIAEEANPVVCKAMDVNIQGTEENVYNLVGSRAGLQGAAKSSKRVLGKEEPFETSFIDASERDCQAWTWNMEAKRNFLDLDLIGILVKHSARDDTLPFRFYS